MKQTMLVWELIEELRQFQQNAPVLLDVEMGFDSLENANSLHSVRNVNQRNDGQIIAFFDGVRLTEQDKADITPLWESEYAEKVGKY